MLDLVPAPKSESSPDFEAFRQRAYQITGLDLTSYKVPQMYRRLSVLLTRVKMRTFAEYARLLEQDPARRQEFRDFVTINVSEFFRDGDRFGDLERRVLGGLIRPGGALRAWSAGCSIGAEPYSLAMLLLEMAPGRPHTIMATDIDDTILARARSASDYLAADIRNVGKERIERWFSVDANNRYTLKPAPRALVTFRKHDLLRDRAPGGSFDLVLCRNVVIYFTEAAKDRIYTGFVEALRPGGILFIGATEAIMQPKPLWLQVVGPGFYQKTEQVMARAA
jgi:chemotaxis protein methyltransferase CheR